MRGGYGGEGEGLRGEGRGEGRGREGRDNEGGERLTTDDQLIHS